MIYRLHLSQKLTYSDPQKQKAKDAVDFAAMEKEILEMQEVCGQLQAPIVWSHSDLLSGNVMIPLEVRPRGMLLCIERCQLGIYLGFSADVLLQHLSLGCCYC